MCLRNLQLPSIEDWKIWLRLRMKRWSPWRFPGDMINKSNWRVKLKLLNLKMHLWNRKLTPRPFWFKLNVRYLTFEEKLTKESYIFIKFLQLWQTCNVTIFRVLEAELLKIMTKAPRESVLRSRSLRGEELGSVLPLFSI